MVTNSKLAVIDFQDARLGPPTYDLVSLCFDSYIPFKPSERAALLESIISRITEQVPTLNRKDLLLEAGPMLLQRQLKAIGSFGYLTVEKNRGNYLKYIVPALQTMQEDFVFHEKWPFLSQELLRQIQIKWQEREHA